MSKAKKIAIICDDSGNISGTNLSGTNTGDQVIPVASSTTPANLGTAAIGTGITFARADHVHEIPILSTLTFGTGLSGTSYNTSSAVTIAIDSTVTTLTGSQTLTNKTLTSPAVTTSLTTESTTFNLLNTTATTINFGSAATAISIGDTSHTGITSIQHDLYVYGNITFGGGSTQLSATELVINDPLIYIGDNNVADITDLGIVGAYNNGAHLHTGLVRDASDSVWKLFSGMTGEPTGSTLDFTGVTYATLQVGSLTSTIATGTAPFVVTSTTPVANLSIGGTASNITAYTINQNVGTANTVQHSDITTARAAALTTGYVYYGNTGTKYAGFDGTNFVTSMPMSFSILGSSASCTGNAATATTATNQSGGTVSATTGAFSGTMTLPTAAGSNYIKVGTGDDASFTTYNLKINSWWGIGFGDYQDLATVKAYIDCRSGNIGTSGAFVGALTGNVTGNVTGSSGSCTGNAATATTTTNQSGGTVSATTGAFSGVVSMSNNIQYTANSTYGINFNGASTDMHRIYLDGYWTIFKSHANEGWKFRDNSNVDRVTITGAAGNITTSGTLNAGGNIIINNGAPTLYFQDTDQQCAMLHNNSNLLYILRGGINTLTWSTVGSGSWPMTVNLTNNDVTWGGNISAIYNITAYASDKRLKENIVEIPNAIEKIKKIRGVTFDWNDISETHGFIPQQKYNDVGVIAQEIEEVLPQVVTLAPFDTWIADPDTNYTPEELEEKSGKSKSGENYKTVQYDRIVPLLIQAIKEQQIQIDELKELINKGK